MIRPTVLPRRRLEWSCVPTFVLVVAVWVLCSGGLGARAEIKAAADPKARTERDYLRSRIDFNRRTLAGAYRDVGKRDAKWDAAAEAFLDGMADYFGYARAEPLYLPAGFPPREQLTALAKATQDAGCDDPMVLYCRGVLLHDQGHAAEAMPLVQAAADGLAARKYPALRVYSATQRMTRLLDPKRDAARIDKYRQAAWDAAVAAVSGKVEDRDVEMLLLATAVPPERYPEFLAAVEKSSEANPWLVNYLRGSHEIDAAWEARGSGWANTVTDDGWRQFYAHLTKARDSLTKAYALHPDLPQPAIGMITVALGAGDQLNEKPRDWFDKAVAARLDCYDAYTTYVYTLLPRWGGSHEQMFAFGLECLETGRYDTYVPYQLMKVVEQINADSTNDGAIFDLPEVRQALRRMLAEMSEKSPTAFDRDGAASDLVGLLWRDHDFRHASVLLDKLGDRVSTGFLERTRAWPAGALSQIRAMTSPQSTRLYAAEEQAERGDDDGALRGFREAAVALPNDHPGRLFLAHRLRMLEIRKPLLAGEWVDLKPDASLIPWAVVAGAFKLDPGGGVVATADETGLATMLCRADVGDSYEVRASVDFPDPAHRGLASVFVQWWAPRQHRTAGISGPRRVIFTSNRPSPDVPVTLKGGDEFTIKVHDEQFDVEFAGRDVVRDQPLSPFAPKRETFFGIGINGLAPGAVVKFNKVEVRRINPGKPN